MQFQKPALLGECVLFCNFIFYNFESVRALVGQNIREAMPHEFPFVAGIIRKSKNFQPERDTVCTAALITKQDILTAEHCLLDEFWHAVEITIGSIDLNSSSKHFISWLLTFSQWAIMKGTHNDFDTNDISILRLTECVASGIPYAELSYLPYSNLKEKSVVAVGWGESNNYLYPTKLQTMELKILRNSKCVSTINAVTQERVKVDKNLLCSSGEEFALLMTGDSGGPLLYNNKIIAINTGTCPFPEQRYNFNKVNIHLNIYFYKEFLTEMKNQTN